MPEELNEQEQPQETEQTEPMELEVAEEQPSEEEPSADRLLEKAKYEQAVQLYELLTNPETAPSVIQELARQHGVLQQTQAEQKTAETESLDWFSQPAEQDLAPKIQELEQKLQKLVVYYEQEIRRQAVQRAMSMVRDFARRDGVPLSGQDVEKIVEDASQLVVGGMTDQQVQRILETTYLAHVHRTQRAVQQKKQEVAMERKPVPQVEIATASAADTLDARVDAVIRSWMAKNQSTE